MGAERLSVDWRKKPAIRWGIWIALASISATGLRDYRVDNAMADWVTGLDGPAAAGGYVVVGGPTAAIDIERLAAALRRDEHVAACISPASVWDTPGDTSPVPWDFVISRDGSYAGLFCLPRQGVSDQTLVERVRAVARQVYGESAAQLAMAGPAVFHVELNAASQRRLPLATGAIVLIGVVMMRAIVGRWSAALAAAGAILLSQVTLLGLMAHLGVTMDMAVSMVPPMMMAIGYSYAAHHALRRGVRGVMIGCLVTTALGIGSFALADVRPIRSFALFGMAGLVLVYAAVTSLVPCVRPARRQGSATDAAEAVGWSRWSGAILIAAAALAVSGGIAAPRLGYEHNPIRYFDPADPFVGEFNTLNNRLAGMLPFAVTVSGGAADAAGVLLATPGVRCVIDATGWAGAGSPGQRVLWGLADAEALASLIDHEPRWAQWAAEHGMTLHWSGVAAQLAKVESVVIGVALGAFPSMLLIAAVAVGLLKRSVRWGVLSAVVNGLPAAAFVGLAAMLDWPLGLPSVMIAAIAVGMAVDDTLHLAAALTPGRSIRDVMAECGRPCVGSSLVAAACMGAFMLCPFRPTAQFGALMALSILAALAADMLVLPAALPLVAGRGATVQGLQERAAARR